MQVENKMIKLNISHSILYFSFVTTKSFFGLLSIRPTSTCIIRNDAIQWQYHISHPCMCVNKHGIRQYWQSECLINRTLSPRKQPNNIFDDVYFHTQYMMSNADIKQQNHFYYKVNKLGPMTGRQAPNQAPAQKKTVNYLILNGSSSCWVHKRVSNVINCAATGQVNVILNGFHLPVQKLPCFVVGRPYLISKNSDLITVLCACLTTYTTPHSLAENMKTHTISVM